MTLHPNESRERISITHQNGEVILQMPGAYLRMTPGQASQIAMRLACTGRKAEGKEVNGIFTIAIVPSADERNR